MKKPEMAFICPIQHGLICFCVSKGNSFVKLFVFNFFQNSVHFFVSVTVNANKISGENIIFKFGSSSQKLHAEMICKRLNPKIQRCSNDKAFYFFLIHSRNEIQCIPAHHFRIIFLKKKMCLLQNSVFSLTFQNRRNKTSFHFFCFQKIQFQKDKKRNMFHKTEIEFPSVVKFKKKKHGISIRECAVKIKTIQFFHREKLQF